MNRHNSIKIALAAGALAVTSTGCGRLIERATEEVVEEAVEQAVESEGGEDVEIDFSDGEIRVESSEGDVTFSADEDGVQIDGTDADGNDFSVDADEGGLEVESEDASLDVDEDGTFVATDGDGEVITGDVDEDGGFTVENSDGEVITGDVDDDGGFTVENGDGEEVFATSDDIPDEWPDDVPQPEGLTDVVGTYFAEDDAESIIISGTTSGDVRDVFDRYAAAVEAAGFDETSVFTQDDDAATATYERDGRTLSVNVLSFGDSTEIVVALT